MFKLNDKQVETFIGQVLRFGVVLSSLVTAVGLALYLSHHGSATPDYRVFNAATGKLFHLGKLFPNAIHGNAIAIIQIGVLLLIATPVARVAFLVGAFALERDRLYVGVSGAVLAILLYSILIY